MMCRYDGGLEWVEAAAFLQHLFSQDSRLLSYFIKISSTNPAQTDGGFGEKGDSRGLGDYSRRMCGNWRVRLLVRLRG
jgi:hypothetical protein